ncbi:MAG TPA: DNA repair protein RecO [Phycisphaerae bacterium]
MANYVTDDGICLRVTDFSETSQIVGMFTRRHGLVPLIAKGAKRASKKNVMSGPLDLLTGGEVVFVPAKGGGENGTQLGTLAAWELSDHRTALRGNLMGLNAAMMCAEVTAHLMMPLDPHEELFGELEAALELLGDAGGNAAKGDERAEMGRILVAYVKAALSSAGYWPQLDACMACGKVVGAGDMQMRFSVGGGGVFCGGVAGCYGEGGGMTMGVPGNVVVGLSRLALPTGLKAHPPERAADVGALAVALEMLLAQVEGVSDKGVRTRGGVKEMLGNSKTENRHLE